MDAGYSVGANWKIIESYRAVVVWRIGLGVLWWGIREYDVGRG